MENAEVAEIFTMEDALSTGKVHTEWPESAKGGVELSVIVPTFNEHENVVELIQRLKMCLKDCAWEVIFVDDDSSDGTADLIRRIALQDPAVRCIQRIGRRGLSSACIEGMLTSSAPYFAVMDGDLQHDESLLPKMLEVLRHGGEDIVVGSRYQTGGGIGDWAESRAKISRFATRLGKMVLRADLNDPMSGFFMLRRKVLEDSVRHMSLIGFKVLFDLFASSPQPLKFIELPFHFRTRKAGESKLDTQAGWDYMMLLLDKLVGHIVPVRFFAFGIVGSIGVVVHFSVLAVLLYQAGLDFFTSQSIATLIAISGNYALNNIFTYRDMRLRGWRWIRGWASFTLACSVGAVANVGIASYLFNQDTRWMLAALSGIMVGTVWNYAMTTVYTWGRPK